MISITNSSLINHPEQWVEQCGEYLFGYALKRVSDRELARDLVQETLLAGLNSITSFDGKSSFQTWITGILRHKIMDHFRKKYRGDFINNSINIEDQDLFIKKGPKRGHWITDQGPRDWGKQPDSQLRQQEFLDILNSCLNALPNKIADVFRLSELDSMESTFICKEFGITPDYFWVIMHRARKRLRKCLEHKWL